MPTVDFTPVLAGRRFKLGEGPHYDGSSGTLTWVDIVAGETFALHLATGSLTSWTLGEPVSVMVPRRTGGYLVALKNRVAFLDPATGRLDDFAAPEAGRPGNRSNESRVDPTGRFWLGTMQDNIGPDGRDIPVSENSGALYRIEPDGTYHRVEMGIGIANTLIWDEDRSRLYFGDSVARTIWSYDWDRASGAIGNRRVFAATEGHGDPDGSALDQEGFLWNARWGGACIIRYAPDGRVDRVVEVPARQPTSCVFGGEDHSTLFVTSAAHGLDGSNPLDGALLKAEVGVKGQPCTRFAG